MDLFSIEYAGQSNLLEAHELITKAIKIKSRLSFNMFLSVELEVIINSLYMQRKSIVAILKDEKLKKELHRCMHYSQNELPYICKKLDVDVHVVGPYLKALKRFKKKFPRWQNLLLAFSEKSLSQSSSEFAAYYKTNIMKGKKLLNLTGGLGTDDLLLSSYFNEIISIDKDENLNEMCIWNMEILGINNVSRLTYKTETYLFEKNISSFDLIYLDPDRRVGDKKAIILEDYSPNIFQLMPYFIQNKKVTWLKLSPLIDLDYLVQKFGSYLEQFHLVGIKGEVKEILIKLNFQNDTDIKKLFLIQSSSYAQNNDFFFEEYTWPPHRVKIQKSEPQKFIYKPNSLLIKSKYADSLAVKNNLSGLAITPSLYTSDEQKKIQNFIGYSRLAVFTKWKMGLKFLAENTIGELVFFGFSKNEKKQIQSKFLMKSNNKTIYYLAKTGVTRIMVVLEKL